MQPSVLYRRIRRRCDLQDGEFIDDDEIGELAEEEYLALWDLMVTAHGGEDAPWELSSVSTVANQGYVDIPITAGCYRLLRLDADLGGPDYVPIDRGQLITDPWKVQAQQWTHATDVRYYARRGVRATAAARVSAGGPDALHTWRVHFTPTPTAVHTVRMFYVPPPILTLSDDDPATYSAFPDEHPEYVVAAVARKIAIRQEADPTPHESVLNEVREMIRTQATPIQVLPRRILDQRRWQRDNFAGEDTDSFLRR